jgi:hypothetical protein
MRKQKQLLNGLLEAIAVQGKQLPRRRLTAYFPIKGRKSEGDLMIVGRSPNGWSDGWLPKEMTQADTREKIVKQTIASSNNGGRCPMLWVTDNWGSDKRGHYNAARSAFWRISRAVVSGLGLADGNNADWPSYLMYSNLCKIAPYMGGNPSNFLCEIQRPICNKMLAEEMEEWKPRRILFLTGLDWLEWFLEGSSELRIISRGRKHRDDALVQLSGAIQARDNGFKAQFTVCRHPQGKPEAPMVAGIIRAFR